MSRMLCFDKTYLRKDLLRFFPLWLCYTGLVMLAAVVPAIRREDSVGACRVLLLGGAGTMLIWTALYGFVTAVLLFGYLFKSRSAYMIASFPVRRGRTYGSHVLAGLLFCWVPCLLGALCLLLSPAEPGVAGIWLLIQSVVYLYSFAVGVLGVQCAGNYIGAGLWTAAFHFYLPGAEQLLRELLVPLLYGVPRNSQLWMTAVSPTMWLMNRGLVSTNWPAETEPTRALPYLDVSWGMLGILTAVGLLALALGLVLYRRRPMESAGDLLAFPRMKPVFRILFVVMSALGGGLLLLNILFRVDRHWIRDPVPVMVCVAAGALLGSLGGEMLLRRSFRVFDGKQLARAGFAVAGAALVMLAARYDLFRITWRLPEASEVACVQFGEGYYDGELPRYTDEETIREVIALQELFQNNRDQLWLSRQSHTETPAAAIDYVVDYDVITEPQPYRVTEDDSLITFRYTMKDGGTMTRSYRLYTAVGLETPEDLGLRLNALLNRPDYARYRFFRYWCIGAGDPWEYLEENLYYAELWTVGDGEKGYDEKQIISREALPELLAAMRADQEAMILGDAETLAFAPDGREIAEDEAWIRLDYRLENGESLGQEVGVNGRCENLLAFLRAQGMEI